MTESNFRKNYWRFEQCHRPAQFVFIFSLYFFMTTPLVAIKTDYKPKEPDQNQGSELVDFNFSSLTDIKVIADQVARLTRRNIIWDHHVKGKIKIIAPNKLSPEDAYNTFLSSLNMLGLTTIETGKITKIMSLEKALKNTPKLFRKNDSLPTTDQLITQLIPLRYVQAKSIIALLSRFANPGSMIAINSTNTLIVSDSAQKVRQILVIVEFLDVGEQQAQFHTMGIKHGLPSDIAEKINSILAAEKQSNKKKKTPSVGKGRFKVLGVDSHNFLAVIGASSLIERVRKLKNAFDQPASSDDDSYSNGKLIRIHPLEFADAVKVAGIINALSMPARLSTSKSQKKSPASPQVTADPESNSIVVVSSRADYESILYVVRKLDRRKSQVLIQAEILDISEKNDFQMGTSILAGAPGKQNLITGWKAAEVAGMVLAGSETNSGAEAAASFANGLQSGTTIGVLSAKGIEIPGLGSVSPGAFIRLLKADSSTRALSSPYLLTQNHEKASFAVGEVLYYRHMIGNGIDSPQPKVEKENIETNIELKAAINTNNYLSLTIGLDSTELTGFTEGLPQTNRKKLTQKLVLKSGQTMLIAGMVNTRENETLSKIPFFGDLPILGSIFRQKKTAQTRSQLAIFITPYIIHDAADLLELYHEKLRINQQESKPDHGTKFNASRYSSDPTSSERRF